ncbi:thermotolerance [Fusarium albosuccineum]|uniref:Thermotolerance n=1 Tax=Fusarium albosuccineum TaxID=1237068 RepID=A0A8H4LCJ1_9HYPO|nr:thermotolerance [Fusarium albosuccineum]
MAFQSSSFRDGQWVTETVNLQDALKASSAAPKAASEPRPEAPTCGILSRTIIESPVIHWILPAWLRSRSHNDIAFVGDRFVQISELREDGQVHEVIRKSDFGARIRNALVLGAPPEGGPDGTAAGVIKSEDTDVFMQDPARAHDSDTHEPLPPQLLVVMLETGDAIFLFVRERLDNTLEFVFTKYESPRNLKFLGFHLSIDPSSRYMAAASAEGAFLVYELESLSQMSSQYQRHGSFQPVKSIKIRITQGIIHKMEFLHPRPEDDYHIILLLIIIRREASRQAHVSRMVVYDWELGEKLAAVFRAEKSGTPLPKEHRMPLMIVPLRINNAFFAVSEHSIGIAKNALTGQTSFDTLETHSPGQTRLHHGAAAPLWTAWARPFRLNRYFEKTDIIYLAREDGVIAHIEIDSAALMPSVINVGTISTNISTAFTTAYDVFSDVFIIGGDSGPGGIWKLPARSDPQQVSTITNWSPAVDLATTDVNSSWTVDATRRDLAPRRKVSSTRSHKPDRIFCTSGRGPRSSLTELRWGIQARIGLEFDYDQLVRQSWMFPVEIQGERGFYAILSLPHSSDVLHFPANLSNANALSSEVSPFDTASRTISAIQNEQGTIVQVTEASTSLVAPSQRHPSMTIYSLDGREIGSKVLMPESDSAPQEPQLQMEAFTSVSTLNNGPNEAIIIFGTRSGHLVTIRLSSNDINGSTISLEQLGMAPSNVFPVSGPFDGSLATFACCDNNLVIMTDYSDHDAKFKTKNFIWPTDSSDPSLPSLPIHSVYCLKDSLSGYRRYKSLMMLAGTKILLVDIWPHVGPVPRSIPLDGTPMRVIYSQNWKTLVVAHYKDGCPTLSFIDPDSGATISGAADKEKNPSEHISGLGHAGDKVFGLYEWLYVRDGKTFPFIIVTTQQGRLMIVSVLEKQIDTDNGPTRHLQYWTRYKKKGFVEPIYSVVGDAVGLLFCVGNTLHWEVLDLMEKKLKPMKQFRLDSPATSLRVVGSKVCALTASHSLQVVDLHVESEEAEVSLIHSDQVTRYTGHAIEMGDSEDRPGKWPVSVISTSQAGFAGVWIPWGRRNKEFEVVFEGFLPTSVRRFRRGRTRPFWLVSGRQRQYDSLFSTVDQGEILGVSLDGSLQHFTLLGIDLWRFLRLIQNLAYHSTDVCPFLRRSVSSMADEMDLDMDLELEPQPFPAMMHIDGDLLQRCLDLRALGKLVTIGDGMDLFCEYLDGIDKGIHTQGFRDGEEGQSKYLELGYKILEFVLAPAI